MIDTNPDGSTIAYAVETDHLGTPRLLTDATQQARWRWTSPPFGDLAPAEDPSGLGKVTFNLRFPGQYYDRESGLSYNWNRYYDAGTGRYLQSDPIGLQGGWNTYSYVSGNPMMFIDPQGLMGNNPRSTMPGYNNKAWANPPYIPPQPNYCATAECAAGLLPAPLDLRTQSEVDRGQCKLVCQIVTSPPVAACNAIAGGGIPGMIAGTATKAGLCSVVCN